MNTHDDSNEYQYLHEDIFTKNFYTNRELKDHYTVHICLVSLIYDTVKPFIKVLFEKNNTHYILPLFELKQNSTLTETNIFNFNGGEKKLSDTSSDTSSDISSDNEKIIIPTEEQEQDDNIHNEDTEDTFFDSCRELFNQVSGLSHDKADELYKGFVENENDILVIFDITGQPIHLNSTKQLNWIVASEIIQNNVMNLTLPDNLHNLFRENLDIITIYDNQENHIEIPTIAYLCNGEYNELSNKYYDESNIFDTSIIEHQVNHPVLDNIYLFSINPINNIFENIKRYAVFNMNAVYILQDELKDEYIPFIENENSVYFFDNNTKYCSFIHNNLFTEL